MSVKQGMEANNAANPLSQIPTEKLAFVASLLFLIGSGISIYVAYQDLKNSSSTITQAEEVVL